MASTKDIFNSKFDEKKLVGNNNFFNSNEELKQYSLNQEKYISSVDYNNPENFARFGSAEEYYKNAITYISSNYPYNGSTSTKLEWINSLNELEYYIFKNEYPKSIGYASLSGSQYIKTYSHIIEKDTTTKDYYNYGEKYVSNSYLNFSNGISFEAWLNFDDSTYLTNILNLTAITSSAGNLGTNEIIKIYKTAGSNSQFYITDGTNNYYFNKKINNSEWHHYCFNINNGNLRLFVDGNLNEEIKNVTLNCFSNTYKFGTLGLFRDDVDQSLLPSAILQKQPVFKIGSGSKFSIDEARFWNEYRTVESVGRSWFTTVDGNDFSDLNNSQLIFYYKFNEGWDNEYKFLCLDYSGIDNDGEIVNYVDNCRITGSAINLSSLVQDEEKQDIIFKGLNYSQEVKDFYSEKIDAGKEHDLSNMHLLYNKFPAWIIEQEEEQGIKHIKQIIQIVSSYFDDLYNKISEITKYKIIKNNSSLENIYPFYDKILTSTGFDITDLFTNLNIIEKIASRSEENLFDENVQKVKNAIFQNIYNNLSYILKSKGTEKSIKSFLRSYGINDNLLKINLYSDNASYNIEERYKEQYIKKKTLTLSGSNSIYLSSSAVPETSELNYYSLEASFILPKNIETTYATSSLFGIQNLLSPTYFNNSNYQYDVLLTKDNNGYKFNLYKNNSLESSTEYINDIYDDSVWNICLRKRPIVDTLIGAPLPVNYKIELYCVNKAYDRMQEHSCSVSHTNYDDGYLRYYLGSKKTNLTGSSIYKTNIKMLYCNFWDDYLNNDTIIKHNMDVLNYGADE